ncbi:DNA-binding protein [Niabella ginsenosidivorans]|uniref:DNA-binding protein n=1 Tax=Niabella ginsenosidivorans TaxID=1176587 RepID=A0A1A9IAE0_9BACT|nr:ORF6N domain-containing protein [Niabella ginsenosidivorans]ANH83524.1 DNA-binding protein [Niabella ginsenosidivorans]
MQLKIIQQRIYEIKGQRVMLDFDLARLYQVETKRLKEAVRRNIKRFPEDFMFELTKTEFEQLKVHFSDFNREKDLKPAAGADSLRTQIATIKNPSKADGQQAASKRGRHSKYLPFAFTEHGVTMLASVLNSDKAIEMNIVIVRAFIALKQLAVEHKDFMQQLKNLRTELHERIDAHDSQLSQIYEALENMLDAEAEKKAREEEWKARRRIGF